MTLFRDTDAAASFIATADSRNTSPEVMRAISYFAKDMAEAEALWNGDGFGTICHRHDVWEHATWNGRVHSASLHWGDRTLDQIMADEEGA